MMNSGGPRWHLETKPIDLALVNEINIYIYTPVPVIDALVNV